MRDVSSCEQEWRLELLRQRNLGRIVGRQLLGEDRENYEQPDNSDGQDRDLPRGHPGFCEAVPGAALPRKAAPSDWVMSCHPERDWFGHSDRPSLCA